MAGLVVVWMLVAGSGSAWATVGHTFGGQFGGAGSADGQFVEPLGASGPAGIAVTPSTGQVVAVDETRVQRFNEAGAFGSAFPLDPSQSEGGSGGVSSAAVDAAGAVYVATGFNGGVPSVLKYSTAGVVAYALDTTTSGTSINHGAQVAVDPADGRVYVTATHDDGRQVIDRFNATTGAFVDYVDGSSGAPDGGFQCVGDIAVDASHRLYVLDGCPAIGVGKNRVDRYGDDGTFQATVDDGVSRGIPRAVAADPVSDEVYVADADATFGLQITHFEAGGTAVVYTFDAADVADVRGMAVSGAGTVYTSDASASFVERFPRFDGPTVVTGTASSVQARTAVLEGTIDPEGVASSYHFEYSTDLTFGFRTPDVAAGSGNSPLPVSAPVTGLRPNTLYNVRIVGSNDSGSIIAGPGTLMTATAPATLDGTPPAVSPPFASAITPRSARIHGTVNSNSNFFVSWTVEYGKTTAYGSTAAGGSFFGGGGDDRPVATELSGLEPGTLYHFRLVAPLDGIGGSQQGVDRTFVTAPAASGGATDLTTRRATLKGTINPRGVATTYHFNYGLTTSYGSSTPEVDGGSGDGDRPVSQEISGLTPDTTYHVQVVATSADGVVRSGGDGLFRTAPAPRAVAIAPTGISTDAATLSGDLNTFGLTGNYHFDVWSLDSSYAISTPVWSVAGYASVERVSAALSGLPAGETFVVQLSVSSNDSVSVSDLLTFATAKVPRVFPVPPTGDATSVYGCGSPRLDAYNSRPKPGETITITGRDLGVGGSVVLGDESLKPAEWSARGFKVSIPEDAAGSLALTADCGHRSNTIAVAVFQVPENGFTVPSRSVSGSMATLRVAVPGPGKLESFGAGTKAAEVAIKKPGTATIKVKLTSAEAKALDRSASHTRMVKVRVRFTPAGGRSASKTVTITFKRKGAR